MYLPQLIAYVFRIFAHFGISIMCFFWFMQYLKIDWWKHSYWHAPDSQIWCFLARYLVLARPLIPQGLRNPRLHCEKYWFFFFILINSEKNGVKQLCLSDYFRQYLCVLCNLLHQNNLWLYLRYSTVSISQVSHGKWCIKRPTFRLGHCLVR